MLLNTLLSTGNIFIFSAIILMALLLIDALSFNMTGIKDWFLFVFKKQVIVSEEELKEITTYLSEIHYFNQLSEKGKERFVQRTLYVIKRMHFSSSDVFELTLKNKALIASSIVQITFGLKYFYIHTIKHIRVFQKEIMNPRTKQQFYGLMFTSGKLYLSWERFEKGVKISNDGVNLGLHETTHGLLILLKHHKLNFDEFERMLASWYAMAEKHIVSDSNTDAFFRRYASANKDEFFSVLVENFFERPVEFKKRMPALYDEVCVYFYQDPTNVSGDFRINTQQQAIAEGVSMSHPGSVKPLNLIQDKWHWSFTLIVLFGYFSFIANLILKNYLASSFGALFISYLISFPVVYVLLKKTFVTSGRMSLKNYRIMSFFSLSPIIVLVIILLNLFIPVSGTLSEKYVIYDVEKASGLTISEGDISYLEGTTTFCILESENSYSIPARQVDNFSPLNDPNRPSKSDILTINYHYGLTGLKVFEGNEHITGHVK